VKGVDVMERMARERIQDNILNRVANAGVRVEPFFEDDPD
jgi:hypothetical protein